MGHMFGNLLLRVKITETKLEFILCNSTFTLILGVVVVAVWYHFALIHWPIMIMIVLIAMSELDQRRCNQQFMFLICLKYLCRLYVCRIFQICSDPPTHSPKWPKILREKKAKFLLEQEFYQLSLMLTVALLWLCWIVDVIKPD